MSAHVTELSLRWKRAPDSENTIALANAARGPLYATLIQEVGSFASSKLSHDASVLVAVARMYMSAQYHGDAQSALVAAGRVAPREPAVYRVLGEVLLRRGDAERAEKVLERSQQLGSTDPSLALWLDRARVLRAMQARLGPRAVADEVEKTDPAAGSSPMLGRASVPPKPKSDPGALRLDSSDVLAESDELDEPTSVRLPFPGTRRGPPPSANGPTTTALAQESLAVVTPGHRATRATGENMVRAGAAPARGQTPADMPKAPASFRFDGPLIEPAVEESVTFDLALEGHTRGRDRSGGAASLDASTASLRAAEMPRPRDLLDALALTGVFEERGQGRVEWTKPNRTRTRRGTWLLAVATVLFVGGAGYTYRYVQQQRAQKRAAAEALMASIDDGLAEGQLQQLPELEKAFARAFELDSRSTRAALAWARERALVGLLRGGQDVTFEDAAARARKVGVADGDLAFTQVASYLFQNDNAGAVALLPKYDEKAKNDPYYELVAGACLERLGDARARERYSAAVKLAPALVPAQIFLIRYEIVEGERARAAELVTQFRARHPDRPEGVALAALLWARDPAKPKPPPEAVQLGGAAGGLPLPLAAVPHAVAARVALEKPALPEARDAINKGLGTSDGPGMASWLGLLALEAEDDALARKAALVAVAYSAVYPRARVLAARVALQGGRLDEAQKAAEELDAATLDVAVARGVVAYERADFDALARALEGLPADKRGAPSLQPLVLGQGALMGKPDVAPAKLVARAASGELWSDIVAMDVALDTNNLDAAAAIGNRWLGGTALEKVPALRALRLSRLARYQGRLDDAETLSVSALAGATPTLRSVLERTAVLIARGKPTEVPPLLAKYAAASAGVASWLGAWAVAAGGKVDEAKGRAATLEPPPDAAPLPLRMAVASALGAMKDKKRGVPLVEELLKQNGNPDVVTAAQGIGLRAAPKGK